MIALSTIADIRPVEICAKLDTVKRAIENVQLSRLCGVFKTIAKVAALDKTCKSDIIPILISQLKKCILRDVAMHFENSLPAIDDENKSMFLYIIETRKK